MLRVGIIDSGVNFSLLGVEATGHKGFFIRKNISGNIIITEDDNEDFLLHGTVCAQLILAAIPDVNIFSARIFGETAITDEVILVSAIRLCLKEKVDVINISLGIQSDLMSDSLIEACEDAYVKNIPIIAANHNDNKICFPAYYPKVFGVGNWSQSTGSKFIFVNKSPIDFFTNGNCRYFNQDFWGSSFACPKITAEVLKIKKKTKSINIQELREQMIKKAQSGSIPYPLVHESYSYDDITDFDKEKVRQIAEKHLRGINNLENFQENVVVWPLHDSSFQFMNNIDFENNTGSYSIIQEKNGFDQYHFPNTIVDKSKRHCFDTIALGDISSVLSLDNKNALSTDFKSLLENGKKFIVFDETSFNVLDSITQNINSAGDICYYPVNRKTLNDFEKFKYLPSVNVPVIALIGVGEKEIISVQLFVSNLLQALNYNVGYIAPVAHGEILNACFSFPLLSAGMITVHSQERIKFLQYLSKAIQAFKAPDIILSGTPKSIIPVKSGAVTDYADIPSFLIGLMPDIFIVVVYGHDSFEAIMLNMEVAKSYTKSKIGLFLIMDDLTQLSVTQNSTLSSIAQIIYRNDSNIKEKLICFLDFFFTTKSDYLFKA